MDYLKYIFIFFIIFIVYYEHTNNEGFLNYEYILRGNLNTNYRIQPRQRRIIQLKKKTDDNLFSSTSLPIRENGEFYNVEYGYILPSQQEMNHPSWYSLKNEEQQKKDLDEFKDFKEIYDNVMKKYGIESKIGGYTVEERNLSKKYKEIDQEIADNTDCIGNWKNVGECSAPCTGLRTTETGMHQNQIYGITTEAGISGDSCEASHNATRTISCSKTDCHRDCQGQWELETPCDAQCDGTSATATGNETFKFNVDETPEGGGSQCSAIHNQRRTDICNTNCDVDCVGSWEYGTCSGTVCSTTNGTRTKTYRITIPASGAGRQCPHEEAYSEVEHCSMRDGKDCGCVGDWGDWSNCHYVSSQRQPGTSTPCGWGRKYRTFIISHPATGSGSCSAGNNEQESQDCRSPNQSAADHRCRYCRDSRTGLACKG